MDERRAPAAVVPVRRRTRGRLVLSVFAMTACAGIALVTVTDPYAGATAAPFYQAPALVGNQGVQRYEIDGGYVLVDIRRDSYRVVEEQSASDAATDAAGAATSGGATYTTPSGTAQAFAAKIVASRGWAPSEFSCLVNLWNRESGWNTHAANPSGAYGIPQALPGSKMGTAGGDWQNSAETQIRWGLGYISGRYGSPCAAWGHSSSVGWY